MNSKIHYYKFVRFMASWKVLLCVLVLIFIADYFFPTKNDVNGLGVLLFLYFSFYITFAYIYYRRGGKKRLEALESGDVETLKKFEKRDNIKYIIFLVVLGITLLYSFIKY